MSLLLFFDDEGGVNVNTLRKDRIVWPLLFLLAALSLVGCGKKEPNRFDAVQKATENKAPAVAKEAEAGSSFNKFFPKQGDGFDIVYKQEKKGFAQASLKQSGKDVATLSISDTSSTPDTLKKFASSTEKIGGYPSAANGSMGTSVLVADRFQVQVRSVGPTFTKADREAWLQKFDLDGLSRLK
jgi:predicted small lipoprotein YifL